MGKANIYGRGFLAAFILLSLAGVAVGGGLDEVFRQFTGPTYEARRLAAKELQMRDDPEIVPRLIEVAGSGDKDAPRGVAAQLLGIKGDPQAIPVLMELLQSGELSGWAQGVTATALGRLGATEAVPLLVEMAQREKYVKREPIEALAMLATPEAMDALLGFLQEGDENMSRKKAARALGYTRRNEAVAALGKALVDEDRQFRLTSGQALLWIGTPEARKVLTATLSHADRRIRFDVAALLLAEAGDEGGTTLLLEILSMGNPDQKDEAARALLHSQDPRVPAALMEVLPKVAPGTQRLLARRLGEVGSEAFAAPLAQLLEEADEKSAQELAGALFRSGPGATSLLLDALGKGTPPVRRAVVKVLGGSSDPEAAQALVAALEDEAGKVRMAAAESLLILQVTTVEEALEKAREKGDDVSRRLAEKILLRRQSGDSTGLGPAEEKSSPDHPLLEPSLPSACLASECHGDLVDSKEVHLPVGQGRCDFCHRGERETHPDGEGPEFELQEPGTYRLCRPCHGEKVLLAGLYEHEPVAQGECLLCHDPHGTDEAALLKASGLILCGSCHSKLKEKIMGESIRHGALGKGDEECASCHLPHSSEKRWLLKKGQRELCSGCHQEIGKLLSSARFLHTPAARGECSACHFPHSATFTKLLKKSRVWPHYYGTMWMRSVQAELCWDCHDKEMTLIESTTKATAFRNGFHNLHFTHVNQKKGRSCKACHESHGSDQEFHIRPDVPFGTGGWKLPIDYTKTEGGGSCQVGCHREMAYDREHPVSN